MDSNHMDLLNLNTDIIQVPGDDIINTANTSAVDGKGFEGISVVENGSADNSDSATVKDKNAQRNAEYAEIEKKVKEAKGVESTPFNPILTIVCYFCIVFGLFSCIAFICYLTCNDSNDSLFGDSQNNGGFRPSNERTSLLDSRPKKT